MKNRFTKRFIFAGKSLVWATALYSVCMLALYRDDIMNNLANSTALATHFKTHSFTLPRINDTTLVPGTPHTGIFISSQGIKTIQVSIDGLIRLAGMFRK